MDYKVIITEDAELDFDGFVKYLLFEKKNEQAATNLLNDFEATVNSLSHVAGSLKGILLLLIIYFMNYRIMKVK